MPQRPQLKSAVLLACSGTDDGAPRTEAPAAAPQPAQTPAQPATPSAPTTTGDAAQLPTFDVLRVEPDGSAVIAGKAQPGSQLEIVNKGEVIAKTPVEGSGDFAAVLDNPLPPATMNWCCAQPARTAKSPSPVKWRPCRSPSRRTAICLPWSRHLARPAAF